MYRKKKVNKGDLKNGTFAYATPLQGFTDTFI